MLLDVQVIKSVSGKNNPQAPYSGSIMIHTSIRRWNLKTHLGNLFLSMIRRTVHTYCALLNSSGDVRTGLSVLESSVNNQAHQLRKKSIQSQFKNIGSCEIQWNIIPQVILAKISLETKSTMVF